jgi:cytochrome o ubiquinol oxidase subunit 1
MTQGIWPALLGRFNWHELPFVRAWENPTASELIGASAALIVIVGAVVAVALITRFGKWRYLWTEWLTSLDHKKIGIMYIVLAFVMQARHP